MRPTSPVHSQAAYAVRRLLEADASKRGGVTLKSLTLAPHITAKKVRCIVVAVGANSLAWPCCVPLWNLHSCPQCAAHQGRRGIQPGCTARPWTRCTPSTPALTLRLCAPLQATYAVTCEVLKHLAVLQQLLEATQLVERGRGLTQPAALVLAYELLFGEGVRATGPAERAVLQRKVRARGRVCAVCEMAA